MKDIIQPLMTLKQLDIVNAALKNELKRLNRVIERLKREIRIQGRGLDILGLSPGAADLKFRIENFERRVAEVALLLCNLEYDRSQFE